MNGLKTHRVTGETRRCGEGDHKQSPTAILGQRYVQREHVVHTRPMALVMVMYSRRHSMPTHRSDNLVARSLAAGARKKSCPCPSVVLECPTEWGQKVSIVCYVAEDVPMRLYKFFFSVLC